MPKLEPMGARLQIGEFIHHQPQCRQKLSCLRLQIYRKQPIDIGIRIEKPMSEHRVDAVGNGIQLVKTLFDQRKRVLIHSHVQIVLHSLWQLQARSAWNRIEF